jgi:hypothetical protein
MRWVRVTARQLALGVLVQAPVGLVVAQPVAEQQAHARSLAALGEDVDVDVLLSRPEHAVPGLADADVEAVILEPRAVRRLVVGVVDGHDHVDDRLRREAGHGGRAEVLDLPGVRPERGVQGGLDLLEALGPRRVVVRDHDRALLRPADEHGVVHQADTTSGS